MFFKMVGLSKKTPTEIERVFKILDQDKSGYIEQDELQLSSMCRLGLVPESSFGGSPELLRGSPNGRVTEFKIMEC